MNVEIGTVAAQFLFWEYLFLVPCSVEHKPKIFTWWLILWKGVGVHPPTLTRLGWFSIMMECTPESGAATLCVLCDFSPGVEPRGFEHHEVVGLGYIAHIYVKSWNIPPPVNLRYTRAKTYSHGFGWVKMRPKLWHLDIEDNKLQLWIGWAHLFDPWP